ncbi:fumarylacetoacetate hydrolase family protein [Aquipuribacter nitratireducens]|uniref:Fumarylacetoacetate hydrolase family protein n=1 Tax=Aquipuribacter nitratireducens TaxID=650104 RepID=A0ABW0GMN3_9MICO
MRLVGVHVDGRRHVARRDGEDLVVLAPVEDFWADPTASLTAPGQGPRLPSAGTAIAHPVPDGARVLCLGLNYRAHAAEGSFRPPEHPLLFGRWTASLVVDGTPVTAPVDEVGLDWEGEVAAVVGRPLDRVDADTAREAVLGYAAFNDLTARRAQKLTSQWTLGKNAEGSGPMGDLVTADEVGDLRDGLRLQTLVGDEVVQDASTADMLFEVGDVLALVSRTMVLRPGDVLVTGTPEGVGYVRTPPRYLRPGDTVTVRIERVGSVSTPVVAPRPASG